MFRVWLELHTPPPILGVSGGVHNSGCTESAAGPTAEPHPESLDLRRRREAPQRAHREPGGAFPLSSILTDLRNRDPWRGEGNPNP